MGSLGLHRKAMQELREARDYYAEIDLELAREFLDEYLERVRFIVRFPQAGARIPAHRGADVRRFLMERFPYKLIVATVGNRQTLIAIAHDERAPDYWHE